MNDTTAAALDDLGEAMRALVPHFPFSQEQTLHCDCGWYMPRGGKLDWWAHIESAGAVQIVTTSARDCAE